MITYDPILVDLTSYFFVLCTNVKVYLYNYSYSMELSMNIYEGKGVKKKLLYLQYLLKRPREHQRWKYD